MIRRSWWLFTSRKGLIILCVIVVLGMGLWTGWSIDHRLGDAVVVALYQGFSCAFIVLAMALVRKLFEFRSVRILFDVLAVLTWAMIVLNDLTVLTQSTSVSSGGKREGMGISLLFTFVSMIASVFVVTVLGLYLKLRTRFKKPRTK